MAWVEKRTSGWIGGYRVDGRKRYTRTFKRKRDAETEASRLEEAGKSGSWTDPALAKTVLDSWYSVVGT